MGNRQDEILISTLLSLWHEGNYLQKALEIDPKYALGYYDLGVILAKQRTRDGEANRCLKKAIELDPGMGWAYYSTACIDALVEKRDEALKNLERALEKGFDDKKYIDKDTDLDLLQRKKPVDGAALYRFSISGRTAGGFI